MKISNKNIKAYIKWRLGKPCVNTTNHCWEELRISKEWREHIHGSEENYH